MDDSKSRYLMFTPERTIKPGTAAASIAREVHGLLSSIEQAQGGRSRPRYLKDQLSFDAIVTALLANLLHFHLSGSHEHHTGISIKLRHSSRGSTKPTRYRHPAEGAQLRAVVGLMSRPEAGLVEADIGWRAKTARDRRATRLTPGPRLWGLIQRHHPTLDNIDQMPPREVIVMKGDKQGHWDAAAPWVHYEDTPQTARWRAEMLALNDRLVAADLRLDPSAWPADVPRVPVDLTARHCLRYFNRNNWQEGGRLFGGFWMSMKSRTRAALRIGGEPISIVDYATLFPRLLYAQRGIALAPDVDLYAVPGFQGYREGIKRVMAALLFRDGPLERLPKGSSPEYAAKYNTLPLLPRGTTAAGIEAAIREFHAPIADCIGCTVGFRLLRRESDLLLNVLRRCAEEGFTALPIHDAVAVPAPYGVVAKRIMEESFREVTGVSGVVTIKNATAISDALSDEDGEEPPSSPTSQR